MKKQLAITRGIKNCRSSWLFKGCSPLQLLCNLIGNRPQSATFHTANRYVAFKIQTLEKNNYHIDRFDLFPINSEWTGK
jgi:hypothetical protein